jgi:hypothetical protein
MTVECVEGAMNEKSGFVELDKLVFTGGFANDSGRNPSSNDHH